MEWLHNEVTRCGQPFGLVAANYCGSAIMQLSKVETSPENEDLLQDKAQVQGFRVVLYVFVPCRYFWRYMKSVGKHFEPNLETGSVR